MMQRVKIIYDYDLLDFEVEINNSLDQLEGELIDIKIVTGNEDRVAFAMIIYDPCIP